MVLHVSQTTKFKFDIPEDSDYRWKDFFIPGNCFDLRNNGTELQIIKTLLIHFLIMYKQIEYRYHFNWINDVIYSLKSIIYTFKKNSTGISNP